MSGEFHYRRRVEFCETDAGGFAHFSAYFQYMEQAEHALLRQLGASVMDRDDEGVISWPRVSASCDYTGAIRFEEEIVLVVRVQRVGTKSVTYGFEFQRDEMTVATGQLVAVCCRMLPGAAPRSIAIPSDLAEQLRAYC